ncbi:MAG TPA: alcohol dehydrogenase catalytic domain-containing protein [Steroidobacteraceae bacterium]|nr:alcohol dehydrogenase catalytic domain-containing protein [Steroidobacteraceae bacterium]
MKAAVFRGAGKPLSIETLDDPKPGPNDVIIQVQRCGICGTDVHMTAGHRWAYPVGCVPGHEYAGEIVEVGSRVEGFKVGERITALPSLGCGRCDACAQGNLVLCHHRGGVMGGFGEYLCVPTEVAVKLPSTFSLADGALIEPFAVGLYGVRMAAIRPGDRVLVLGGGSVALATLFWARRLGAGRIVALSRSPRRAALALEMGADAFIPASDHEVEEVIEELGRSPDIVFECVGATGLLSRAIQHAGVLGQVLSLGFCTSPDTLVPALAAYKGVRLSFPVGYSLRDFEFVADTLLAGRADPKRLISSVVSLDELPGALEALRGPNTETKVQVSLAGL